jgi:thiosulfate/3-mercaptopyruvate sulfurtransferase
MFLPLSSAALVLLSLAAADYPRSDLLIEAPALEKAGQNFLILDARPREQYETGHVPNAVWVNHAKWSKAFAAGQDPREWAERLSGHGINTDRPVVVYDDGSVKDAARIWWILHYWGVRDVRLLDGGWHAWREAGGREEKGSTSPEPVAVELKPRRERLATRQDVLAELKDHHAQIVDARSQSEYCGEARTAKRNGAIPGAKHLEWSDLLDPRTKKFKSADELRRLFREAGIDVGRPAVTYCQSGGRASVLAFGLELMGAKDVRNYYRSWAEWGNAEDTPVETPKK